jgi:hypothetical protein
LLSSIQFSFPSHFSLFEDDRDFEFIGSFWHALIFVQEPKVVFVVAVTFP